MSTHIIVCSANLLHCEGPYARVYGVWPQQLQRVVDVNLGPLRQQLLDGLLDFRRIPPRDGLEELRQTTLVAREVESELPDEILLFRCQRLAGSVVENLLQEAKSDSVSEIAI